MKDCDFFKLTPGKKLYYKNKKVFVESLHYKDNCMDVIFKGKTLYGDERDGFIFGYLYYKWSEICDKCRMSWRVKNEAKRNATAKSHS